MENITELAKALKAGNYRVRAGVKQTINTDTLEMGIKHIIEVSQKKGKGWTRYMPLKVNDTVFFENKSDRDRVLKQLNEAMAKL